MESALVRYNGDLLSSQQSEPQQLHTHPTSDQLKACFDVLYGALSGSSYFSFSNVVASSGNPLAAVNTTVLYFKLSSVWKVSTASFEVFVIVMLEKDVFLNHNSAGFHRTSSF